MKKKRHTSAYEYSGILFAGCVVLGLGIGMLCGRTGAGVLIGVGVGLIAMGISRMFSGVVSRAFKDEDESE
ncbi:hypothetical protein CH333_03280 [candidate division WOR-3 bacterium JGI_Cruoil_03_44_89]|uniref:Uncharacterized protein n=1 Tax=candidate division WOR-3 bacterium JGI_Cruoil_03_44_89 TaxID=1973748 RepID=A0A235BVS4_UNCW3|nr:MAG: hypothetical protein CH333_07440 [candidate division WOR-3 bacterium JGI_Cruoil_03_44_89]OYD16503.1 MAG: hypothetical protein CH333_03280 [candidate division WOR-3 bacterium JGI_Cruoil_03_44_89]